MEKKNYYAGLIAGFIMAVLLFLSITFYNQGKVYEQEIATLKEEKKVLEKKVYELKLYKLSVKRHFSKEKRTRDLK